MCPRTVDQAIFRLLEDSRDVTPISYCGDCLVVDWGGGHLRAVPESGRGSNLGHANFARALGKSLLGGFLVKCVVVVR